MDKKKLIILLTVFIDVLGIGIIIPILPYYVESFGVGALAVTLLFSVFSLFSFFSAPLLGAWSDKVGRRPILILSIFSTAIGWLVFAEASSVIFLFVGRIIDGLAAGNLPIAQSYLTDLAHDEKERMANLGLIGGALGLGFIIGPAIGGVLSSISPNTPFWFVGLLALTNGIAAIFFLPETNTQRQKDKKIELNPFTPILNSIKQKVLRKGYIIWLIFGTAIAIQQSIFALYVGDAFKFTALKTGLLMTAVGIIITINQALLLKKVWLKHFSQEVLTSGFLLTLAAGFLLMSLPWLWIFLFATIILTFSQSVLRITLTNHILREGAKDRQGEILGVLSSVMSLAMVIGPLLAGFLYSFKINMPFISAFILVLIAYIIIKSEKKLEPETKDSESDLSESEAITSAEQKMELA